MDKAENPVNNDSSIPNFEDKILEKLFFVKFSYFFPNRTQVEQKCWETILRVRETILRGQNLSKNLNVSKCSYF